MKLGIFLSPGDSLAQQKQTGQLERLIDYYLKPYTRQFERVLIFSYGDKGFKTNLPNRVKLIPKPKFIHNYLYQLIMPLIQAKNFKSIDVFRVMQAPGGLPALAAKLLFRKPYVVTYGYDYVWFLRQEGRRLLAGVLAAVIPLILRQARRVIVTDPKNLLGKKAVLIPNGVDPQQFKPQGKRRSNLVLSVGRLEPQKNFPLLVQAASQSRFKSQIKLVIIGRGSQKQKLLSAARRLGVKLKILDNLPHRRLINWYQAAAIFALISKYEGHPKTLIEALSCACPVLTTNFSGNPVINGQSGLITAGLNGLTAGMDQLLSDKTLAKRLGDNGRRLALMKYNIRKLIQQEIKLLSS